MQKIDMIVVEEVHVAQIQQEDPVMGPTSELLRVAKRAWERPDAWPRTHVVSMGGPPDLQVAVDEAEGLEPHDRVVLIAGIENDDGDVLFLSEAEAERAVSTLESMLRAIGSRRTDAFAVSATYYELSSVEAELVQSIHPGAEVEDDSEVNQEEADDEEAYDEDTDLPDVDEDDDDEDEDEDEDEDSDNQDDDSGDDDQYDADASEETAWVVKIEIARTKVKTGRTAAA